MSDVRRRLRRLEQRQAEGTPPRGTVAILEPGQSFEDWKAQQEAAGRAIDPRAPTIIVTIGANKKVKGHYE